MREKGELMNTKHTKKFLTVLLGLGLLAGGVGCETNAQTGALIGTGIGAGLGAAVGALSGAAIGNAQDQQERARASRYYDDGYDHRPPPPVYREREYGYD